VKSLLNRRSVLAGPSHLVQVARENTADPVAPDDSEEAALAAATGVAPAAAAAAADTPAAAPAAEPARPVTTLRPVPVVPSQVSARGVQMADTAEIEWLAEEEALTPFRVFRSFAYSVSLLFHAKELAYYVALYQDGSLWRALKAADLEAAETAFHHFEEQATRLSEGETRRAQLEAQNEQLARMIARSEAQAERLRTDLEPAASGAQGGVATGSTARGRAGAFEQGASADSPAQSHQQRRNSAFAEPLIRALKSIWRQGRAVNDKTPPGNPVGVFFITRRLLARRRFHQLRRELVAEVDRVTVVAAHRTAGLRAACDRCAVAAVHSLSRAVLCIDTCLCGLQVSRVVDVIANRVVTSLFELHQLSADFSARNRLVRLCERSNRSNQSGGDDNCRDKSLHDVNLQNL